MPDFGNSGGRLRLAFEATRPLCLLGRGCYIALGLQADLLSRIAIYDPMSGSVATRPFLMHQRRSDA
jgi:hypothetical protein